MRSPIVNKTIYFLLKKNTTIEISVLLFIFTFAAWFRFRLPNIPLSDPDTWGYLFPALSSLAGDGFQQTHGRGIAYPLFLRSILSNTFDFFLITKVQHIIGLSSGLLWWAIWRQWISTLPLRFRFALGIQLVGLIFLAAYLWNANAIFYESMIRPEAIFPFLALLQTLFIIIYIRHRWFDGQSNFVMVMAGSLAMVFALVCVSAKPSWGFAATVPLTIVGLGLFGCRSLAKNIPRVSTMLIGVVLCILWLQFVPRAVQWKKDERSKEFLPATMFTVHAPTISKYLNEARDKAQLSENEMKFLAKFDQRIAEAKQKTLDTKKYRNLGHDPDYLMYHSDTLSWFPNGNTSKDKRKFMMDCYLRTVLRFPLEIATKILWQIKVAFSDLKSSLYQSNISFQSKFSGSLKSMDYYKLPEVPKQLSNSYSQVYAKISELKGAGVDKFSFGPGIGRFIANSFGPFIIGLTMLLWPFFFCCIILKDRCLSTEFIPANVVFGVLWASCMGTTLTVAVVHSFDISRYIHLLSAQHSLIFATVIASFLIWAADRLFSGNPATIVSKVQN